MIDDRSIIKLGGTLFGSEHDAVRRVYIVVHELGRIPEKKIPPQTPDGVTKFLFALQLCRPKGTTYTVVKLVWDGDIWVESGAEWLCEAKLCARRMYYRLRREAIEEHNRISRDNKTERDLRAA